jgi:predicted PurR-regulated permease PerM
MDLSRYTRRVLIAVAVLIAFLLAAHVLKQVAAVLLLLFAGVLLAVLLEGLATKLCTYTSLSYGWGLALVVTGLTLFFVGAGWYAGPRIDEQFAMLGERIPNAIEYIRSSLEQYNWGRSLLAGSPDSGKTVSVVMGGLSSVVGGLSSGLVVLIVGLYLSVDPYTYINGALRLVSSSNRDRVRDVIRVLGHALRWWLVGRIASMGVVGVLTAIGLWIAGVPLAIVLGLIAALLSFVPYIGPIVSFIPAALVALADDPASVLYVLIVYVGVQILESNLITPLIQERAVSLAPAVLIAAQLLMGVLVGVVGIFIATPLAVVCIVLVQTLYIEDVLDEAVTPLGE